jgi:hypothetical protein
VSDTESEIVTNIADLKQQISTLYGKLHKEYDRAEKYGRDNDVYELTNGTWTVKLRRETKVEFCKAGTRDRT